MVIQTVVNEAQRLFLEQIEDRKDLLAWHCAVLASLASSAYVISEAESSLTLKSWNSGEQTHNQGQLRNVCCYCRMNAYFFSFNFAALN